MLVLAVVIMEVKRRQAVTILGQRQLCLRKARLMSAVIAKTQARGIYPVINIVYKVEKALIFTPRRSAVSTIRFMRSIPISLIGG